MKKEEEENDTKKKKIELIWTFQRRVFWSNKQLLLCAIFLSSFLFNLGRRHFGRSLEKTSIPQQFSLLSSLQPNIYKNYFLSPFSIPLKLPPLNEPFIGFNFSFLHILLLISSLVFFCFKNILTLLLYSLISGAKFKLKDKWDEIEDTRGNQPQKIVEDHILSLAHSLLVFV